MADLRWKRIPNDMGGHDYLSGEWLIEAGYTSAQIGHGASRPRARVWTLTRNGEDVPNRGGNYGFGLLAAAKAKAQRMTNEEERSNG